MNFGVARSVCLFVVVLVAYIVGRGGLAGQKKNTYCFLLAPVSGIR